MARIEKLQNLFENFFRIGVTIGLLVPLYIICENLFLKFRDSSMAFTIDSSYLDFNTSFPSISLCQVFNGEKNWDLSERFFGDDRDKRIDDFLTEISFFTGACYTCELCDVEVTCPSNFSDILGKFRANCQNFLKNCSWNEKPFECCEGFRPLATETGTCYSINSALTQPMFGKELFSNRENGPGRLKMMVTEDIQIFIHHPNDIPFVYGERDLRDTILWGSTKDIIIKVTEIINDETVLTIPVNQRRCRFSWENEPNSVYNLYSFSTCQTNCYNLAQISFCNCTHHLMPRDNKFNTPECNFKGLVCLTENFMKISEERKACTSCISSCEEYEYRIIFNSNEEMGNEEGTDISVSMLALPTHVSLKYLLEFKFSLSNKFTQQRYFRRTVKTNLDFVISIGGIFGLFFGFSFISIFEIMYKVASFVKGRLKRVKKMN